MSASRHPGLLIAAPSSNSGKTVVCLSLLRAFARRHAVQGFKVGPDYLDPMFHRAASGRDCYNLDPWAMGDAQLAGVIGAGDDAPLNLAEGVMGLFDGAVGSRASSAELSQRTGWPVVLVVDCQGMAASVAALVSGFAHYAPQLQLAGVILNRVGSVIHAQMLREALQPLGIPVFGHLLRQACFELPRRHLGLLQAAELGALNEQLDACASAVEATLDLDALARAARPCVLNPDTAVGWVPDLGPRVAIANDLAFSFCYPHWRRRWRQRGVEISRFSPLADEPIPAGCSGLFLPGGYPELHAEQLSEAKRFLASLRNFGGQIHAECGGYMSLGDTLTDGAGRDWPMAGLLPVHTSFAERRLHLGYRQLDLRDDSPLAPAGSRLMGHEFHYASTLRDCPDAGFAEIRDARGGLRAAALHRRDKLTASFMHLIDAA